ncbi:MAG: hypothetical protein SYNGOMJ08_00102 [Candidatus Syntrophoarchaeum sp. GoM_oil]|nr:MAG: hypothetical protein SYNGOMJ08_00102 [Candidatus Syntrophoarchaeum sp. GoM_oil]
MAEYILTAEDYYKALKEDKLMGLKCTCGAVTCPPMKVCDTCGSEELEVVQLSGKGTLRTFTVSRVAPEGFEAPYCPCIVETDEGPWVPGRLNVDADAATQDLLGKRVTATHYVLPADKYSAGEMVAALWSIEG